MLTVTDRITIHRKAEEIWDYLIDLDNLPVYESQVTRVEQITDGDVGVGTRWRGSTKVLGRNLDWVTECTVFEPARTYTFKTIEAKLDYQITWTLTPSGDGTDVDYRLEAASGLGGMFGKLGDSLVIKAQQHTVKANLANLKELLEADV